MKNLLMIVGLSLLASISMAQKSKKGGVTSNGVPGKILVDCVGDVAAPNNQVGQVHVTVLPILNQGLVIRAIFSENVGKKDIQASVTLSNDLRGRMYVAKSVTLLIPDIQPPADDTFQAILLSNKKTSQPGIILVCNRNL